MFACRLIAELYHLGVVATTVDVTSVACSLLAGPAALVLDLALVLVPVVVLEVWLVVERYLACTEQGTQLVVVDPMLSFAGW